MSTISVPDTGTPAETFRCRSCRSERPSPVLQLGDIPASDVFPLADDPEPDARWPLTVYMCPDCALVQLGPAEHPTPEEPTAVDSATAIAHAARSAAEIVHDEGLVPHQTVIEIDSLHGGSWLPSFEAAGLLPVGPDERADLVVDVHFLMHEEDLDAVIATHADRLADGGVLVCEFFTLRPLVDNTLIDTIRHGHFVYLSLLAAEPLFARHGLVLTRAKEVPSYGGSLRLTARRAVDRPAVDPSVERLLATERARELDQLETLRAFAHRGAAVATGFREHLQDLAARGSRVAAYGAPSKAAVLLALSGVDVSLLPYTVDLSPAKHGHRIPGAGVPIRAVEELIVDRPDDVVVLTWDIAQEVTRQLARMSEGSRWRPRFYVPLPTPRTLSFE